MFGICLFSACVVRDLVENKTLCVRCRRRTASVFACVFVGRKKNRKFIYNLRAESCGTAKTVCKLFVTVNNKTTNVERKVWTFVK